MLKQNIDSCQLSNNKLYTENTNMKNRNVIKNNRDTEDHTGQVRGSRCLFQPYINDPVTTEALAVKYGVKFCKELGFQAIVIEGDAHE